MPVAPQLPSLLPREVGGTNGQHDSILLTQSGKLGLMIWFPRRLGNFSKVNYFVIQLYFLGAFLCSFPSVHFRLEWRKEGPARHIPPFTGRGRVTELWHRPRKWLVGDPVWVKSCPRGGADQRNSGSVTRPGQAMCLPCLRQRRLQGRSLLLLHQCTHWSAAGHGLHSNRCCTLTSFKISFREKVSGQGMG